MSLRVVIACPFSQELADRIAAADDRLDVVFRPDLFPPQRFESDWAGEDGWERTPGQTAELDELLKSADVLLSFPDNSAKKLHWLVDENPDLTWVHTIPAGGGSQVKAAKLSDEDLQRIEFTTSAGVHAAPLAEFAVLGALMGLKELPRLFADEREHVWSGKHPLREMKAQTALVVGMGSIGRVVAERYQAFGTEVLGVNRSVKEVDGVEMHTTDELAEVAKRADILVNCLPAAVGTDGLISREVLENLHENAIIVSLGRGSCVDETAMIELLQSGHLAYAALDVFEKEPLATDSPLWDMPNVFVAPHTMALSADQGNLIVDIFIRNAKALLDGGELENRVNKELFY